MSSDKPKISIIVPVYNGSEYLEACLESVVGQDYPNTELIIIDGGSDDGSCEIIKRYEPAIAYWVSEADNGQTHAINKGLAHATGELWMYLNSDDLLESGALQAVAEVYQKTATSWICGTARRFDEKGACGEIIPEPTDDPMALLDPWNRKQRFVIPCSVASYMTLDLYRELGAFDESLRYCMDTEYGIRAVLKKGVRPHVLDQVLGHWRQHPTSITWTDGVAYGFRKDSIKIARDYFSYIPADKQSAFARQLKYQEKLCDTCEANALSKRVSRLKRSLLLLRSLLKHPSQLVFRPWWGACKRALFA